jgi:ubiquinone/menaquinone biosynthesis C-methylase UbiE
MSAKVDGSVFDHDVLRHGGYLYTTGAPLSSQYANKRLSDIALLAVNFKGKRILDLGSGDGAYTKELFDRGKPFSIHGIDPSKRAIEIAKKKYGDEKITFAIGNADSLPYAADSFDLVHIRGVLHHMDNPAMALKEALRVAAVVLLIEPNGYNLGLKVIEKLSHYHREHQEKSYTSYQMRNWIKKAGGEVTKERFAGFVPMFCPKRIAQVMKAVEPLAERIPMLKFLACAVVALVAERSE